MVHVWPTPKASDSVIGMTARTSGRPIEKSTHLQTQVFLAERKLLPTPNARDWKNATAKEWDNPKNTRNLNRRIAKEYESSKKKEERLGQLNPMWVEWLMGYPLGWTDLKASVTPLSLNALK
jgi:hypothetical protein